MLPGKMTKGSVVLVIKTIENEEVVIEIRYDDFPINPREYDPLGTMICWHSRYSIGDKHNFRSPDDLFAYLAEEIIGDTDTIEEMDRDEILKTVMNTNELVILPVYMLDHSIQTISTKPFADPWDSGQIGWIYCFRKRFLDETGYTENELFSTDPRRTPEVGERVKVNGYDKSYGIDGFGKVVSIHERDVVVDFDFHKIPGARKPENLITVPLDEIEEVMHDKAHELLEGEVKELDYVLRGEVFAVAMYSKCSCCGTKGELIESIGGFLGSDFKNNGLLDEIPDKYADLVKDALLKD